jgi:hypothetical protein
LYLFLRYHEEGDEGAETPETVGGVEGEIIVALEADKS